VSDSVLNELWEEGRTNEEALQPHTRFITDLSEATWCSRRWEEGRGVIGGLQCLVYVQVRVEPTAVRMGISKQGEGVRHD
jgi:hypothetical protein